MPHLLSSPSHLPPAQQDGRREEHFCPARQQQSPPATSHRRQSPSWAPEGAGEQRRNHPKSVAASPNAASGRQSPRSLFVVTGGHYRNPPHALSRASCPCKSKDFATNCSQPNGHWQCQDHCFQRAVRFQEGGQRNTTGVCIWVLIQCPVCQGCGREDPGWKQGAEGQGKGEHERAHCFLLQKGPLDRAREWRERSIPPSPSRQAGNCCPRARNSKHHDSCWHQGRAQGRRSP